MQLHFQYQAGNWKRNKVGPMGEPAVLLALNLNGSLQVLSRLQTPNHLLLLPEMWVRLYTDHLVWCCHTESQKHLLQLLTRRPCSSEEVSFLDLQVE